MRIVTKSAAPEPASHRCRSSLRSSGPARGRLYRSGTSAAPPTWLRWKFGDNQREMCGTSVGLIRNAKVSGATACQEMSRFRPPADTLRNPKIGGGAIWGPGMIRSAKVWAAGSSSSGSPRSAADLNALAFVDFSHKVKKRTTTRGRIGQNLKRGLRSQRVEP